MTVRACITVELGQADAGRREGEVHLLSNVPEEDGIIADVEGVTALTLAKLYLERWLLETAFKTLTVHLRCEPNTLGYPPARCSRFVWQSPATTWWEQC